MVGTYGYAGLQYVLSAQLGVWKQTCNADCGSSTCADATIYRMALAYVALMLGPQNKL